MNSIPENKTTPAKAKTSRSGVRNAIAGAFLGLAAVAAMPAAAAEAGFQAGSLTCKGKGAWGMIITSKQTFSCAFVTADGKVRSHYTATVRKYGLDLGKTGDTALTWLVFGPASKADDNWVPGSLAGVYGGVGASASVIGGVGANALIGGGNDSFALQPVSVQVQTGLSVAAGVQSMEMKYDGPLAN